MTQGKPDTIVERLRETEHSMMCAWVASDEANECDCHARIFVDALAHIEAQDAEIARLHERERGILCPGCEHRMLENGALRAQLAARDETIEGLRARLNQTVVTNESPLLMDKGGRWMKRLEPMPDNTPPDPFFAELEAENVRLREQLAEARDQVTAAQNIIDELASQICCEQLHHVKRERHESGVECPVVKRLQSAIAALTDTPTAGETT